MSNKPTGKRVEREARLRWIPLTAMRVNPLAQRELKAAWVDRIAVEMELERLGHPEVSHRDELFYIIDGQHRIEAYKKWCGEGNWEDQSMQCWTHEGLSEEDEAEAFLRLNDKLTVATFEKFRVAIRAGWPEESDIDRIVRAHQLRISKQRGSGAIRAVGALRKVYQYGPDTLARTLELIRDSYGDAGFEVPVIEGVGLLCQRYNGELNPAVAIQRLGSIHGGVNGLLGAAHTFRIRTGNPLAHCVAAAAVDIYNRGRGARKLTPWWRAEN